MSTSKSYEEVEIKPDITETTQDVAPPKQVPKIIQNHDVLEFQSDEQASPSEPQKNVPESLVVNKPRKRKLKKAKVTLTENEKLIQLVRCMRCLYDPQHPRHRDTQVCRDLWDIIGNVMDLPGSECEKRWSILKKKFIDIIKNKKKGNWKNTKSLVWYQKYIQIIIDREKKNSGEYPSTSKKWLENWEILIDKFRKSKKRNRDFKELKWLLRCISREELEDSEIRSQKKNRNSNGEVTFLHANDCQCNTAALADPMQKFLAEIATMLKKLPEQKQNLAKIEIFEIVHKFDLIKSTELSVTGIKAEIDSD